MGLIFFRYIYGWKEFFGQYGYLCAKPKNVLLQYKKKAHMKAESKKSVIFASS